ncbi:SEL1-like repeat protein [Halopseudomonas litoralis]|uniref:sel1 repeat family protein n=1 Tax=Halopseudomonas litoralis TaxID=797277 RepID=UPI000B7E8DF4|nr:sel1 repeat family protein [Halopseudomonas litoralis]
MALLLAADSGDSEAQCDLALVFLEQDRADLAAYWFNLAAQQEHADAMHYLSGLYQQGNGVERCESTAMLWRVKAAGAGHAIAQAQMAAITNS